MIVDELAGFRVFAESLGLVSERPDHLRVTVEAAFADVDVAPRELERRVRLHRRNRRHVRANEECWKDLEQRGDDDGDGRHDGEPVSYTHLRAHETPEHLV